jgi:retron-type reverse transcriptase
LRTDCPFCYEAIKERIADRKVLDLIRRFLKQEILEDGITTSPEEGTPQGATLSPLLCNIYLNPLDHHMEEAGFEMIRYADDLVIACRTQEEAEEALRRRDRRRTRPPACRSRYGCRTRLTRAWKSWAQT